MKHINILKKAAGAISILLLILSLAACENNISENASSLSGVEGAVKNSEEGISFKGQIKLQGAAPARSATSSFSGTITWVINAVSSDYSADHDQLISGAQVSALTSENTFNMKIPKEGTYAFTALGYSGSYSTIEQVASKTPLFQGYKTGVEITETGLRTALEITVAPLLTGTAPQNADSPVAETSDYGTINLLINDISESISKLSATLTAYQREMDPIIKETTFDSGETTLHIENVPAGKYTAKLDFSDSDGNVLYSCNEAINVYTGMTTDTWFGTAPYLTDGVFAITSALVSKFGAERVPTTNQLLYNQNGNTNYDYYLVNDYKDYTTTAPSTITTSNSSASYNSLCFDSDGYYYILTVQAEDYICIKSNKPDFGSETAADNNGAMKIDVDLGKRISVDRATNFLYVFDYQYSQITRITQNDGSYNFDDQDSRYKYSKSYTVLSSDVVNNSTGFTVYNNIAYFASAEDKKIAIVNLDTAGTAMNVDVNVTKTVSLGLSNMGLTISAEITDMIYQDGFVYMLLNDTNDDFMIDYKYYSRGAVLSYNCLTEAVKICGWTNAAIDISGKGFYAANGSDNNKPFLKENINGIEENERAAYIANRANWIILDDTISSFGDGTTYPELFSPSEAQANKAFYGPKKFIAIKPKKLVIADEGCAFYTDSNDAFYFKNVNRIVTVDLESFAISSDDDISATFDEDKSEDMVSSGYTDVERLNLANCIYSTSGVEYDSNSSVSVRVRIPLGE